MTLEYYDKFEYMMLDISGRTNRGIIDELNKLGNDGWEVINLPHLDNGYISGNNILLKRKIITVKN